MKKKQIAFLKAVFLKIINMLSAAHLVFANADKSQNIVRCYALQDAVQTNQYASNSVLLSLAAHVTFRYPFMNLFGKSNEHPEIKPQKQQVNDYLTFHPFQELWCDRLSEAIFKGHAIRKDNILYIVLELGKSQFDEVTKEKENLIGFQMNWEKDWVDQLLIRFTGYEKLPRKNRKITYLNVSGNQLRKDPHMPTISVRAVILGQFYNNESWSNFDILKGEIPGIDHFMDCDGIIIPGSSNSVLSYIPQIEKMSDSLFKAFQLNKRLKILGICYGHQLIALKNKGEVVKKIRTDKVEKYKFNEQLISQLKQQFPFLNKMIDNSNDTLLLEHHEDYVENIPHDFHVLASSPSSSMECLLHKSGRILSFQSHPEYFYEFSQAYIQRLTKYRLEKFNDNSSIIIEKNDEKIKGLHQKSSFRLRTVISQFFQWNCHSN